MEKSKNNLIYLILTFFTSLILCVIALFNVPIQTVRADTKAIRNDGATIGANIYGDANRYIYYNFNVNNDVNYENKVYNSLRFTLYKSSYLVCGDNITPFTYLDTDKSKLTNKKYYDKVCTVQVDNYSKSYSTTDNAYDNLTYDGNVSNVKIKYGEEYMFNGSTYTNNTSGAIATQGMLDKKVYFQFAVEEDTIPYCLSLELFSSDETTGEVVSDYELTKTASFGGLLDNTNVEEYAPDNVEGYTTAFNNYKMYWNNLYNYGHYLPFSVKVKDNTNNETYNLKQALILNSGDTTSYKYYNMDNVLMVTVNKWASNSEMTTNEILKNATWFNDEYSAGNFSVMVDKVFLNDNITADFNVLSNNNNISQVTVKYEYLASIDNKRETWKSATYTASSNYEDGCYGVLESLYNDVNYENKTYLGNNLYLRNVVIEVPELAGVHVQMWSNLAPSEVVTYDEAMISDSKIIAAIDNDTNDEESNFFNNFGEKINSWFGSDFENQTAGIVGVVAIALVLLLIFKRK